MNAVKDDVIKLVEKELASANEKFPMFRSPHEGYTVILEEMNETRENLINVGIALKEIWDGVKTNSTSLYMDDVDILKAEAINAACELIQVAAMAQKLIDSMEGNYEA